MAGHAAKKAAKASAATAKRYFPIIVAVNVVYVLYRVIYHFRTFDLWHAMGFVGTSAAYYISYKGLVEAAAIGVDGGGAYFDVLVVIIVAQLVSMFTRYGWYIYLVVPGYYVALFTYWLFQKLVAQAGQDRVTEEDRIQNEKQQKAARKKERKAARGAAMRVAR
ncbi:unnamed protein product [Choristocarpus tenellus]